MKNLTFLFIVIAALLYGLVIRDYQERVVKLRADLQRTERQILEFSGELKALESQEEELGTGLDLAYRRIPATNDQENLIRDIQKISKESGFSFKSLSFGESHNGILHTPQLVTSFSVKGPYAQLFSFLRLLEQNGRFLGMNDIRLAISDENSGRQVNTSLTLYALYQQQ